MPVIRVWHVFTPDGRAAETWVGFGGDWFFSFGILSQVALYHITSSEETHGLAFAKVGHGRVSSPILLKLTYCHTDEQCYQRGKGHDDEIGMNRGR